jgi:proprotein convertase subtilisin/kexin type 5
MKAVTFFLVINLCLISIVKPCSTGCGGDCATGGTAPADCNTCDNTNHYYMIQGSTAPLACYNTAPDSYFLDPVAGTTWIPCKSGGNCKTCQDANTCATCLDGGYYLSGGLCYPRTSPPTGFYFDVPSSTFKACGTNCSVCSDADTTTNGNCYTCNQNFYLTPTTKKCVASTAAPDGYFFSTDHFAKCFEGCKACNSAGTATNPDCAGNACLSGYIWLTVGVNNFCNKSTNPPSGYYYDGTSAFAQCGTGCGSCSGASVTGDNKCLTCNDVNLKVLTTSDGKKNCYSIAAGGTPAPPTGFTWNTQTLKWDYTTACYASCATCSGPGTDSTHQGCLTCKDGNFPTSDVPTNCFSSNPGGYYNNLVAKQWQKCDATCASCSNGDSCDVCASGKFQDPLSKKCVDNCSNGYFKDNNAMKCRPCVFPCANCTSQTACSSCATSAYTFNTATNQCVITCTANQFKDPVGNCVTCTPNCATCSNSYTCNTCAPGFFMFQNNCVSTCPTGFYINTDTNGNKSCALCNSSCATCSDNTLKCNTCATGLVRSTDGTCAYTCPDNYISDSTSVCKNCVDSGRFLYQGNCVAGCPYGLYPFNGNCMTCKESGRYLYNGNCISQCPTSYLFSSTTNQCYFQNDAVTNYAIIHESSDILECDPLPCRNGGTCATDRVNTDNVYYCSCAAGFYGRRCEYTYNSSKF